MISDWLLAVMNCDQTMTWILHLHQSKQKSSTSDNVSQIHLLSGCLFTFSFLISLCGSCVYLSPWQVRLYVVCPDTEVRVCAVYMNMNLELSTFELDYNSGGSPINVNIWLTDWMTESLSDELHHWSAEGSQRAEGCQSLGQPSIPELQWSWGLTHCNLRKHIQIDKIEAN